MYKTSSRKLQRAKGRVVTRRFRMRNYSGRKEARAFFFPVLFNAAQYELHLDDIQKMPEWLRIEVEKLGIVEWLEKNIEHQRADTIARLRRSLRGERIVPRRRKSRRKKK